MVTLQVDEDIVWAENANVPIPLLGVIKSRLNSQENRVVINEPG